MAQAVIRTSGESMTYTAGATAIAAGDIVIVSAMHGVATAPIEASGTGTLWLEGTFDVAKTSAVGVPLGGKVFWNDTANTASRTSSGNRLIGRALSAALSTDTLVSVRISQPS